MSEPSDNVPMRPGKNGGRLRSGGKAKRNYPSALVRYKLRLALAKRIKTIENIADGIVEITIKQKCPDCGYEPPEGVRTKSRKILTQDMLRAINMMAQHGLGNAMPMDEIRRLMQDTLKAIDEQLADHPDIAQALINDLRRIWIV